MSIVAVIPARGGSKGIPGKNKKLLGGIPLVARTIRAANAAKLVDHVYVSSDDPEILAIAETWGASTIFRPSKIAGDDATSEDALLHALDEIVKTRDVTNLVFLQCTSPFTTGEEIDAVVSTMSSENAQSAFSAIEDHGFLWKMNLEGRALGTNHDASKPRQRRQDLDPQFRENGAVYAMDADCFLQEKHRFCGRTVLVPVKGELFEIDTVSDWKIAEALVENRLSGSVCREDVSKLKAVVMDFDGVHTDDRVFVNERGEESVVCSRKDGMGIELLKATNLQLLILSKEKNPVVVQRAKKLGLEVIHGVDDKVSVLENWIFKAGLSWREVAYVGNDINDAECLNKAGMSFVPCDANSRVLLGADIILPHSGGRGAIRSLAELILSQDVHL